MSALSVAVGIALIVVSYRLSADDVADYGEFHVFWVGYFLLLGPFALALLRQRSGPAGQLVAMAGAGLASYIPHFLRVPTRPGFNDELAQFLQSERLFETDALFRPNPIVAQAANFPGLHTLTYGLRHLSGLSTYQCGVLIVAVMHIAVVLSVYALARSVVGARAAGIAALVYAIGPQLGFVDSLYAYESFALPLCAGTLAATALASRELDRRRRGSWLGVAALLLLAAVVTHHLSSYATIVGLILLFLGWLIRPAAGLSRATCLPLAGITIAGTALAFGWADLRNANTYSYLTVYVKNGFDSIYDRFGGSSQAPATNGYVAGSASRTPLTAADKPIYEIVATYGAQVVLFVLALVGLWHCRKLISAPIVFAAAATVAYFASLAFLFSASGQNAAHRSWAFSYLGLAVVVAVGVEWLLSWQRRRAAVPEPSEDEAPDEPTDETTGEGGPGPEASVAPRPIPRGRAVVGLVVTWFLLLGAWGAGINTVVAFPGPFIFQSDGRNVTRELYSLAYWMKDKTGIGNRVLADYRTGVMLTTIGEQVPNAKLASNLMLPPAFDPQALRQVRAGADYIVVDSRLATDVSSQGYYFYGYELAVVQPLPRRNLTRLDDLYWLRVIHRTQHYTVYQVAR